MNLKYNIWFLLYSYNFLTLLFIVLSILLVNLFLINLLVLMFDMIFHFHDLMINFDTIMRILFILNFPDFILFSRWFIILLYNYYLPFQYITYIIIVENIIIMIKDFHRLYLFPSNLIF